jgi:hypothetical protein
MESITQCLQNGWQYRGGGTRLSNDKKIAMKKVLIFIAPLLLIGGVLLFKSSPASAVAAGDWKAGRIVDDSIFTNKSAMSIDQIQQFLNSKVPVCNTNHPPYTSPTSGITYNPPFTCLKDYWEVPKTQPSPDVPASNYGGQPIPAGAKSAAELIYNAAQANGISPQVLLVTLDKEQGLVSDDWPIKPQYLYAMGADCPDGPNGAACDSNYAGFSLQMMEGASLFRYYLDNMKQPWWSYKKPFQTNSILWNVQSTGCGASNVYIETMATAALYTYTPYQPNAAALNNMYGTGDGCSAYGNRNFWRKFSDWFGTTIVGSAPSPLFKSSASPNIYVVSEGSKYLVPNYATLIDYGLHRYDTAIVDQSFLDAFPTSTGLTNLAKKQFDGGAGTIYLFDDGRRLRIQSAQQCTDWALDCFNANSTKTLPNSFIDRYTAEVGPLTPMMANNGVAYKLENGQKRPIVSQVYIDVLGGWSQVQAMKDSNAAQPLGKALIAQKTLVKYGNSPALYWHENSTLLPIDSTDIIQAWNLLSNTNQVNPPQAFDSDPLPRGASLTIFASDSSGNKYLVSNGVKYSLAGQESNWSGFTFQPFNYSPSRLNDLPTFTPYPIFRSSSGEIFTIFNSKKYIFPTMDDFLGLGNDPNKISPVSNLLPAQASFGGFHLASGRLYKISGSDQIYRVNGITSQYVNSTNYPGLPYSKLITVDSLTASRYPVSGTYSP